MTDYRSNWGSKKKIESIVWFKSMFYVKNIKIAANERGLSFIKVNAHGKWKLKCRILFNADLASMLNIIKEGRED